MTEKADAEEVTIDPLTDVPSEEREWGWEIEPTPFQFEWRGRSWEGLADINDPPSSIMSVVAAAQMPAYTKNTKIDKDVKAASAMIAFLNDIIMEWNYIDRRGRELEISEESLASLPSDLLANTFNAIVELITNAPNR